MDDVLHVERRDRAWSKRTHVADLSTLPDGAYVGFDDTAWLVLGDTLLAWSPVGYQVRQPRPPVGDVTVLTPPSIVGVLRAGYPVHLHPSVSA
jgi:hypothetical protein